MKNLIPLSSFTYGEVSTKIDSQINSPAFAAGAQTMLNMRPEVTGGLRSTGGSLYQQEFTVDQPYRLIPFNITESEQYLLCIGTNNVYIGRVYNGVLEALAAINYGQVYTKTNLYQIQFCQNYTELYITHQLHAPKVIEYIGNGLFTVSNLSIEINVGATQPFDGIGNYPGACAFFSGRLWLAGTVNKPQGIWASEAYKPNSFVTYETISYTRTELTDPATWADPETPETAEIPESKDIIGDSQSFSFEIASDKNDSIVWMAAGQDLVIGTISTEWVIPERTNANNITADAISKRGSARIQARMVNGQILFLNRDKKNLIEYAGADSPSLNFFSDHILDSGALEFEPQGGAIPRVFLVLSSGEIAVLQYSRAHGVTSWYRLKAAAGIYESVAVVSTDTGDKVFAIVNNGGRYIVVLDETMLTQETEAIILEGGTGTPPSRFYGKTVQLWKNEENEEVTIGSTGELNTSLSDGTAYIGKGFYSEFLSNNLPASTDKGIGILSVKALPSIKAVVLQGGEFKAGDERQQTTCRDTGPVNIPVQGEYAKEKRIKITRQTATPLQITLLVAEVEVNQT